MPWIIPISQYRISVRVLLMRFTALGMMVAIAAWVLASLFDFPVARHLPIAWRDQANGLSIFLFPLVLVMIYIAPWLWQKSHAGCVLFDLSPPIRYKGLILGGVSALVGICLMVSAGVLADYGYVTEGVGQVLFIVSVPALVLGGVGIAKGMSSCFGPVHFRITATGIFLGYFLKWKRIESYEWGGEIGHTLTFKIRTRLRFFYGTAVEIPSFHKANVDALLTEHLTSATAGVQNDT